MKGNRLVDPNSIEIPREGRVVHLRGYGMVRVFKTFSTNRDVEYYARDDTKMREKECEGLSGQGWGSKSATGASNSAAEWGGLRRGRRSSSSLT